MKLRALFRRIDSPLRSGDREGRASLLALGLLAVLLTVGLAAPNGVLQKLDGGEETPVLTGADVDAPAAEIAAAAEQAVQTEPASPTELAPALAEEEAAVDAQAESEATQAEPDIDLSRVIAGEKAVIRPYGFDYNPNTEDYRFHRGSDLAAASGQPVFAPADGVIREAIEDAYWGGMMVVDFDGWSAVLRCVTPRVEAGTKVAAGEFIASVAPAPAEAARTSWWAARGTTPWSAAAATTCSCSTRTTARM